MGPAVDGDSPCTRSDCLPILIKQIELIGLVPHAGKVDMPKLFNSDRIGILESDAESSPELYDVRDVWWRPQAQLTWRQAWTDTYPATVNGPTSLVVRAAGGVHQLGYDRYAVVSLN
jgi:hypothetical protein